MKKFLCLMLSVLMVVSLAACSGEKTGVLAELDNIVESGVLKVGMECNYTPFNWTQAQESDTAVALEGGGYADGYDVQIAKIIAEQLGVELEIVKTEWDGLIPALTSNTVDAVIAGMSPLADRKVSIDFSDYYYSSELVIVVKKDGAFKDAASLADFEGAKITGQLNTFHYTVIDQIEGVEKQTALADFPAMIVALNSNSIDGYVSEMPGAVSAVASNPSLTYIEFAEGEGFTFEPDDVNVSVGVRKGSDMTAKINEILAGITEEKRIELMNNALDNQPVTQE